MIKNDSAPIHIVAASRVSLSEDVRSQITPGKYDVNFVQHISGKLTIPGKHKRKRTANLLGKRVLALCLHYMGNQQKNVSSILDLILEQAVDGHSDFLDKIESDPRIIASLANLDAKLQAVDGISSYGPITSDLTIKSTDF